MKEQDLAAAIIAWLRDMKWATYQEVQPAGGGPRADIVAKQQGRLWVIETKRSFTFDLVEQAYHWKLYANWVSAAVAPSGSWRPRDTQCKLLKHLGIGCLAWYSRDNQVEELVPAPIGRRVLPNLMNHIDRHGDKLCDQPGGVAGGGYWTPFRQTARDLTDYVVHHPGCSLKEVIANIKTHYRSSSTARTMLPQWIRSGVIPGIRIERNGKQLALFFDRGLTSEQRQSNGAGAASVPGA